MVAALGRPELLSQLAQSLARQVGVEDLRLRIYLFQDSPIVEVGPPIADPELCRRSPEVFLAELPDAKLVAAETNLGIVGNCERMFDHVKASDADAFVFFEEDLILSEHYLATIAQLLTQTADNPFVGLVNCVHELARDLETQRQKPSFLVHMGLFMWSIAFSRRTYTRMANYLDAYFSICRKVGYRCNGRDRPESVAAVRQFFYELGFPKPVGGPAPDVALAAFSWLYLMHNLSTWVFFAKYTGRAGLTSNPQSYDQKNLGGMQLYDQRVETFDIPSVAESLFVMHSWRKTRLDRRLAELARDSQR
jgi:hypothetical protein